MNRKTWKFRLTTMLDDRGYSEQAILELYNFLDWTMHLPEDIEQAFQVELEEFEEAIINDPIANFSTTDSSV